MDRSRSLTPFFAGLALAFGLCALGQEPSLPAVQARAGAGAVPALSLSTNRGTQSQGKDLVYLLDASEGDRRLAIYELSNGRLELVAVRKVEFDLRFDTWSRRGYEQRPTVEAQKKAVEKDG